MNELANYLREPRDVEACLKLLMDAKETYDSVATSAVAEINPHRTWRLYGASLKLFLFEAF